MRYYDQYNNRLVYIEKRAGKNYWDDHWHNIDASMIYKPKVPPFNYVVNITRQFLPPQSLILEGGAGLAVHSWYLYLSGYKTIALDYAPRTVEFLKHHRPEVCPDLGDVRDLPIESECVDGYWSLGVIEHFYDGYELILAEMFRVIKNGGYLFITFPHMNRLRQYKARRGCYEQWTRNLTQISEFYQFALDDLRVIKDFEKNGFRLIRKSGLDGVKGLKDDLSIGRKWLQTIYNGKTLKAKFTMKVLDLMLRNWFSHVGLLVFKKQSDEFHL